MGSAAEMEECEPHAQRSCLLITDVALNFVPHPQISFAAVSDSMHAPTA